MSEVGNDILIPDTQITICLVLLLIISIFGSLGNGIVIYVYKRKTDEMTSTFFILVLAAADLIVCLLVIPYTFAMEYTKYHVTFEFVCKLYYVLNTSNTMFTSLLIAAVALDRYLCICHPMRRILTVARAKIVVAILVAFSVFVGIASCFTVRMVKQMGVDNPVTITSSNGSRQIIFPPDDYICDETANLDNITQSHKVFFKIIQNVNHATFILCIISVIVCYSFVFRVVLQVREKNKTLIIRQPSLTQPVLPIDDVRLNDEDSVSQKVTYHPAPIEEGYSPQQQIKIEKRNNRNGKQKRKSLVNINKSFRSIRQSDMFQNFRSAGMLFVVAFVYILVFCPSLLIAGTYIPLNLVAFYMYYLNNMSNPLIYCFMNRGFRQEMKRVFLRNRCVQKRFNSFTEATTPW